LMRGSDTIADGLVRLAPRRVVNYVEVYSRWMSRRAEEGVGPHAPPNAGKLLRRWVLQIALNGVLAAAVLAVASVIAQDVRRVPWIARLPYWTGGPNTIVWLGAMVLVMPLLIVSFRKLRLAATLVSDIVIDGAEPGVTTTAVRGMVGHTIMFTGFVLIGMSVLLMSSAFLPPGPVLLSLLLWGAGLGLLMWRRFERMYARAGNVLSETLSRPNEPHGHGQDHAAPPLPAVLREAELETVEVAPDAPAAGKLIRDLHLRGKTGASVVGIERGGESIVNPGPDEQIHPDDRVLLLGTPEQLQAARPLLRGRAA